MSFRSKSKPSKGKESNDKSFQLSKNRFVSVSEFKNKIRVDVREFYTDDSGEQKPGRKGISLSIEEWTKLKDFLPKIEKAIKGIDGSDSDSDQPSDDSVDRKKSKKSEQLSDEDSGDRRKRSKKSEPLSDEDSGDGHKKSKKTKKAESESDSSD